MLIGGVDAIDRLDPVKHLQEHRSSGSTSSRNVTHGLPPTINEAGLLHLITATLSAAEGPEAKEVRVSV